MTRATHAHWRIKEVAVAMGHELYDFMMHDNEWYRYWQLKNPGMSKQELEEEFIGRNLPRLLPQARATLAGMLQSCQDDDLREQIYEALLLDATLTRGRVQ